MANSVTYDAATQQTNFVVDQGSSFEHTFTLKVDGLPFDLTDYIARAQVRTSYGATTTVWSATQANGKIAITNPTGGVIKLTFAASDFVATRFIDKDDETLDCVYDVEIESPAGKVYKPSSGGFELRREVTR